MIVYINQVEEVTPVVISGIVCVQEFNSYKV